MSFFRHLRDVEGNETNGATGYLLLSEEQGCVNGCKMGMTIFTKEDYPVAQTHDDQEGFLVVAGSGWAKVGDEEFRLEPDLSFIVPKGVTHAFKKDKGSASLKLFWFHAAV